MLNQSATSRIGRQLEVKLIFNIVHINQSTYPINTIRVKERVRNLQRNNLHATTDNLTRNNPNDISQPTLQAESPGLTPLNAFEMIASAAFRRYF